MAADLLIPFIGGEWHGEKYHVKGWNKKPDEKITVGDPPEVTGVNTYDATLGNLVHENYHLVYHEEKPYYVHWSLMTHDMTPNMPDLVNLKIETPNSRRLREFKEREVHKSLQQNAEIAHRAFVTACIQKHIYLDKHGVTNPGIDNLIAHEDNAWRNRKRAHQEIKDYKGEPVQLKAVAK